MYPFTIKRTGPDLHTRTDYFNTPLPDNYFYEMNGNLIMHDDYWADFYNFNKKYLTGFDRDTSKKLVRQQYTYYCKCGGRFQIGKRFEHIKSKKHRNFFNE